MAVNTSPVRRALGIAGISVSCALALVLGPAAHADPAADKGSVQQQIVQAQHDIEVIAEQYNDAKIVLQQLNVEKAAAQADAAAAQSALDEAQAKVAQTGATLYKGPTLAGATVIMTASTPQEVIDKLTTLGAISDHYGVSIDLLQAGQAVADKAAGAAEKAAAEAAATEKQLADKKSEIEAKLPQLESQLAALTETERQAIFAESGGHAPGAGETGPTVTAGTGGSGTAQSAVNAALSRVGMPYVWGAAGPNSFDCSGLTMWAYAQVGVSLPHSSSAQAGSGTKVPVSAAVPGDILWMPGHVGMYIGNGQVVHAPTSGDVVKVVSVGSMRWQSAVRVA